MKHAWIGWVAATVLGGVAGAGCGSGGGSGGTVKALAPVGSASGVVAVAAALDQPLAEHTLTPLRGSSAWVLRVGGDDGLSVTDTASLIDVSTGRVRALPDRLHEARAGHCALPAPDGEVVIVGGRGRDGAPLASAEVWSPQTEAFRADARRLERARDGGCWVELGGLWVFAGGRDEASLEIRRAQSFELVALAEGLPGGGRPGGQLVVLGASSALFLGGSEPPLQIDLSEPTRPRWALRPDLPVGATAIASVEAGVPDALLVGGFVAGRASRQPIAAGSGLPLTGFELPPLEAPALVALEGVLVVAGGARDGLPIGELWLLGAGGVTQGPSLSTPRRGAVTASVVGRGVISGGLGVDGRPQAALDLLGVGSPLESSAFAEAIAARQTQDRTIAQTASANAERGRLDAGRASADAERARAEADAAAGRGRLEAKRLTFRDALAEGARLAAEQRDLEARIAAVEAERRRTQQAGASASAQTQSLETQIRVLERELAAVNAQLAR